jgi:hypothetical protein
MNKKIVFFIVMAISALSIMAISNWGNLSEDDDLPDVESVVISRYDRVNNDGDKIINVSDIIDENHLFYDIPFVVTPADAERKMVATLSVDIGSVTLNEEDSFVRVTYSFLQLGKTVTLTVKDSRTGKSDSVILLFSSGGDVIITDPVFD